MNPCLEKMGKNPVLTKRCLTSEESRKKTDHQLGSIYHILARKQELAQGGAMLSQKKGAMEMTAGEKPLPQATPLLLRTQRPTTTTRPQQELLLLPDGHGHSTVPDPLSRQILTKTLP